MKNNFPVLYQIAPLIENDFLKMHPIEIRPGD